MQMKTWFLKTGAVVLTVTGLAKVFAATGPARALDVPDPILGLSFRHLLLLVGLAELFIAFFCTFTDKRSLSVAAIAWLSTNFLLYRLGLWWMGWHKPCGCLGNLTDALRISPETADLIAKVILVYLILGSYALLVWEWRQHRKSVALGQTKLDTASTVDS
jgi:hypothetical protein